MITIYYTRRRYVHHMPNGRYAHSHTLRPVLDWLYGRYGARLLIRIEAGE